MKLMLAIALSHDAKLLSLDEPTSGLDVLARDELMDMLHAYIEDGEHSVLFSTHITVDLERAADFITYITGGRLYYTGPKDEFEESFRIVKGGPGELAQLPAGVVLGSHTYQTGFDALVRSDSLGTVSAAVADIVVDLGERRIYCAGAIAEFYTDLGGDSLYFGKPHPPIYDMARRKLGLPEDTRYLAVGDGIATDIPGAAGEGIDALFVSGGLAHDQFGPDVENPAPAMLNEWLALRSENPRYSIGRLR